MTDKNSGRKVVMELECFLAILIINSNHQEVTIFVPKHIVMMFDIHNSDILLRLNNHN